MFDLVYKYPTHETDLLPKIGDTHRPVSIFINVKKLLLGYLAFTGMFVLL